MKKSDLINNKNFMIQFVTTYSIFLSVILLTGLILYHNGMKDAKIRLYNQNLVSLEKAVQDLDSSFLLMSNISSQALQHKSLRDLVTFETTSVDFYLTALDGMEVLKSQLPFQSILPIGDSYIYLSLTNYMLYTSSLSNGGLYFRQSKSYDADLYEDWLDMMSSYEQIYTFIPLSSYKQGIETSLLYRVPLAEFSLFNDYPGFVCFEIDLMKLNNIFSTINLYDNGFLYVTDETGTQQFQISNSSIVEFSPAAYESSDKKSSAYHQVKIDNKKMLLTHTCSENNKWNYYLVQPSELVFGQLMDYEKLNLIIILFSCTISIILTFLLTKSHIKPMIRMNTQLEYSLNQQLTLQEALDRQQPIIYNTYLSKIMSGLIYSQEELTDIISFLNLETDGKKFAVLYCSIYLNDTDFFLSELGKEEAKFYEISAYKDLINHYLFESFGTNILIYEPEFNSFAILLESPEEQAFEDFIDEVQNTFFILHENLIEEHALWIYAGLGNRNSDLSYIWKSYQQAVESASYVQNDYFFQAYEFIERDISSYYYPIELAGQLTNFITAGNEQQVREIFKILYRENFEYRTPPVHVTKWFLSDIRNTLLKIRFTISVEKSNLDFLEKIDSDLQTYNTLDLLKDIALRLCNIFEPKPETNKIIHQIKNFINENYSDPSLSLKRISEDFSISESYFSYLFKAELKLNFSEYLEQLRMEKAMNLLTTTSINISDLYIEVGYNNVTSFRRAFKKVHGVSPKQMRDMHSEKSNKGMEE